MLHYVFSLNYIKKTIKTSNPSYSNYMFNSLLTKKFLSVNRKKKKNHSLIKHNKINTNNKLKVIKKSLDKRGITLHANNGLPLQTCPYKQKHIASDHIHV